MGLVVVDQKIRKGGKKPPRPSKSAEKMKKKRLKKKWKGSPQNLRLRAYKKGGRTK